jgi:hypothetical protein
MSELHVDAAADEISPDAATFASLPPPLAQRILLALPPDARGRACCVCPAWRDALADPLLWTRLDMSGVRTERERVEAVLRAAAGRAHGQLRHIDLSQHDVARDVLLPVLTANAGSLRELHLHNACSSGVFPVDGVHSVEAVVAAAPLLQSLTAENVECKLGDAPRLLRAEPPFALLQVRRSLIVRCGGIDSLFIGMGVVEYFAPFAAALADAALQPALLRVGLYQAHTDEPAFMGALVDAALARRLSEFTLERCGSPAAVLLARLLAEGSLTSLVVKGGTQLPDAAGAALVADALRANTTLTKLQLDNAGLCADMRVAGALLGALVGHPSLRELHVTGEYLTDWPRNASVVGAALAALIAADAPALRVLVCSTNMLRDNGLAPIVGVLALNRHLRELDLRGNLTSGAFARERLLPAVHTNTTLRVLRCVDNVPLGPAATEAEELVRLRAQQG